MKELLDDYPVIVDFPIAWGDMDAFQHVNNIMYFKYFESARISYFERIDLIKVMNETGIGPILASTQCKFIIPLTYPDEVMVGAKVDSMEDDRFTMKYAIVSGRHGKVAAVGEGVLVTYNYKSNRKAPIPNEIKDRISSLEKLG